MKRKNGLVFLSLAVLLLAGCALLSPTEYGPDKPGMLSAGGYTTTRIQDNIFRISFYGNSRSSGGRVEDFALLKSAEVTIENGYKYFVVGESKSETKTSTYTSPIQSQPNYATGGVNIYGGETTTSHKPRTYLTIQCFKEKPENSPTIIYDAEQVRDNIKTQYKIK